MLEGEHPNIEEYRDIIVDDYGSAALSAGEIVENFYGLCIDEPDYDIDEILNEVVLDNRINFTSVELYVPSISVPLDF